MRDIQIQNGVCIMSVIFKDFNRLITIQDNFLGRSFHLRTSQFGTPQTLPDNRLSGATVETKFNKTVLQ